MARKPKHKPSHQPNKTKVEPKKSTAELQRELQTQSERDALAKRRKFDNLDDAMKRMLGELKQAETVVSLNPDKQTNTSASDVLLLLEQVSNFLDKSQYAAAETLLRHIYRVSPAPQARVALASARRLCHVAVIAENKWVRRRATLKRRNETSSTIRAEKKKYLVDKRQDIADLLSTATLEIAEGIERRGGNFYAKLATSFEVILPPIGDGDAAVFAKAPLMFNSVKYLDERKFNGLMHRLHDLDPGLKRIERGFFVCKSIPVIGLPYKLADDGSVKMAKRRRKLQEVLEKRFGRRVNILEYTLTHRSSKLYWYVYDFPVEVEMMQFADIQVAEDYGTHNTALLDLDNGKLDRDQFVKLREEARRRSIMLRTMQLREQRLNFVSQHQDIYQQIEDLKDAYQELTELMDKVKAEFTKLTATAIDDAGKSNGLAISQYKRLYRHSHRMYGELSDLDTAQRDRLYGQLFEDRLKAREYYYEYRDLSARRTQFRERIDFLTANLADKRNITRGSGKNLAILPELAA